MKRNQALLVSIRGKNEAIAAAKGAAMIADVEYPASALGTPYPLNISTVRTALNQRRFKQVLVSTNIGEKQHERANACQAALGVATAGADLIKFGLAELPLEPAVYQGREIVRTVRKWHSKKRLYPAVFVDEDLLRFLDPFRDGAALVKSIGADGLLIDTFNKATGKGLLDYCKIAQITELSSQLHRMRKEMWLAGSIQLEELPQLWNAGADVICVRGAACKPGKVGGRFGEVSTAIVRKLVDTIP